MYLLCLTTRSRGQKTQKLRVVPFELLFAVIQMVLVNLYSSSSFYAFVFLNNIFMNITNFHDSCGWWVVGISIETYIPVLKSCWHIIVHFYAANLLHNKIRFVAFTFFDNFVILRTHQDRLCVRTFL